VGPLTLPAHASMLTALYPPRHGVRDNHIHTLGDDVPMLPQQFKAAGYATGAFVSAIVLHRRYGLARGFDVYDDDTGPLERPAEGTLSRASAWIEATEGPFLAWIHLFEPHAPYRAGSYAREVGVVDGALGRFLDRLRTHRTWANTVVSVTADHGESLGEHGEQTHGFFVYDSTLRIPWILRAPGRPAGRFAHQVRIVDILPTIADLAGVRITGSVPAMDGVSLVPFLERDRSPALEAYAETYLPRHQFGWSELRSLRTERTKYIAAPTSEVYDLIGDPGERRNIATAGGDIVASLSRQLSALERAAVTRPRQTSDSMLADRFMSLGYIGYSPPMSGDASRSLPDPKDKLEVYRLTMDALEASEAGRTADALARLAAARTQDGRVAQVHFVEGSILGTSGRYAEAARALERAVALSPRHVAAQFKLALAYIRTGRDGDAARVLERVLQDEPANFRALHNLAAIAYRRGDLDRATALEREALALHPDYPEAWNTLGAIHLLRREPAEAAAALERATRAGPTNAQAFRNLGLARRALGDDAGAAAAARRACELDRTLCG
jgi:choline-sulfatase